MHRNVIVCAKDADSVAAPQNFRSRIFTLALFTIVVVLLYADQNLMAPNLSAIAEDFGFSDEVRKPKMPSSTRYQG